MAADGYPNTPGDFIQIVATDAFLKGCLEKKAALTAIDKDPTTLSDALKFVRSALANQLVIFGHRKSDIKRVTFEEEFVETDDKEPAIRAVYQQKENNLEQRLQKTEEDIKETKSTLSKILKMLTDGNASQRSRSPITSMSPERTNNRCFNCGSESHFIRDCPSKRSSPNRFRSPSPQGRSNIQKEQLNSQGPRK